MEGAEAAAASMATGENTITFNPARVMFDGNPKHIVNYIASEKKICSLAILSMYYGVDIVSNFQSNTASPPPGSTYYMQFGTGPTHTINDFYNYSYPKKWLQTK